MLILILIDVQYLQNVVFSTEKRLSGENHSSSDSHQQMKKSHPAKFPVPPLGRISPSLNAIQEKSCHFST